MSNNCSNCYNGCTEISSDKCIKYTGVDVPILGIQTGDSLSFVEQSLITFLTSTLDGTGILPVISESDVCNSVGANLPECNPLSLNNYLTAIIKTLCTLEETVTNLPSANPSTPYDLDCLTSSSSTETTIVVQSVIDKVCSVQSELTSFIAFVNATYVKISDINTYIGNYLASQPSETAISNRMVPYSAQAYFGSLNNFDASGAGLGDWGKIYLCNGLNGTPDLRGRVIVTATTGMGGGSMSATVDPANSGNPNYSLLTISGSNKVTLTESEIPSHTHLIYTTATVTDPGHSHLLQGNGGGQGYSTVNDGIGTTGSTASSTTGISVNVNSTNSNTGGNLAHSNIQPTIASYYIIYLP
jgi:microcystin-dependent protein